MNRVYKLRRDNNNINNINNINALTSYRPYGSACYAIGKKFCFDLAKLGQARPKRNFCF